MLGGAAGSCPSDITSCPCVSWDVPQVPRLHDVVLLPLLLSELGDAFRWRCQDCCHPKLDSAV